MTSLKNARIFQFLTLVPKGRFHNPLDMRKKTGRKWEVLEDFIYETDEGLVITTPKLFVSDLASIPRIFWRILPPDHTYSPACVLHDYLCNDGHVLYNLTVRQVSEIFEQAMRDLGVPEWKRAVMFRAVYWFGPKWKLP